MKVLFISRSFPPLRGGMEKVAHNLYTDFSAKASVTLIKWSGSKKWLVFVLPVFFMKSAWYLLCKKIDVIYLCDGFLSLLIPFLRIFKKPIIVTVHGLDITYKNKSYQAIIPKKIALADRVVCVSRATAGECLKRNIPEEKICIVPNGIKDEFYLAGGRGNLKAALERKLKINIGNKKVLLSVGRLIERKGIHWFIKEIVPKIKADCADFVYLVAGCGKMAEDIRAIIKNNALENWVVMVGEVSDEELKILYNAADIFVMPNIPVAGDFEGFGIVILEAASCGLAVVASDMEGIRDALGDGDWGVLIEPLNAAKFSGEILNLMRDDDRRANLATRARAGVIDVFNWPGVAQKYLDIFNETSSIMKLARYSGPS